MIRIRNVHSLTRGFTRGAMLARTGSSSAAPCMAAAVAAAASSATTSAAPAVRLQSRGFAATVASKEAAMAKIQGYHDELLGCNWGDYLELVHNVPFLEAELESLEKAVEPFKGDAEVKAKLDYVLMATDAMYACEDVRDHANELLELMTRKTGILGMGINAGEDIENKDEQAKMLCDRYEALLKEYPEMKPKIEQSVGHGLAILRMKHKFKHPAGHRFFY